MILDEGAYFKGTIDPTLTDTALAVSRHRSETARPRVVVSPVSSGADDTGLDAFAESLDLVDRVRPFANQSWSPTTAGTAHPSPGGCVGDSRSSRRSLASKNTSIGPEFAPTDGDLYATVTPPDRHYDTYCLETLDIGQPEWINAHTRRDPLAVAKACLDDRPFARLVEVVRAAGCLAIHPYMSIEDVWILAERLARESGCPVSVIGSPPPVTWIANDKALFTALVTLVLGPEWTTETHEAKKTEDAGRAPA